MKAREEYLFKLDDLFWQPGNQLAGLGNHLLLIISNYKKKCIAKRYWTFWCFGVPATVLFFMYCLLNPVFADSPPSTITCL